jgi:hypothetical protein
VTSPQLADEIYKRVGGDPLSLRLSVDGLKQDHDDLSQLKALPADFDELSVDHELNQGWLYRRYLSRIRDLEVERLAHPGLVLRQVSPALIREVLAVPCGVDVPSDEVAEDLFERLAHQASLVTRERPNMVKHRSDVRKRMLRALLQTEGSAVFEIHRRAVDFYAKQPPNAEVRAEEIYHRLFIARSRDEIDSRWMPGVAALLRDTVTEIPMEMRSYLIAKLETTSATFDWNEADARSKEEFVATRAQDAIAVNRLTDALRLLAEIRDRLPGSKLFRLEAQTLVRLGRYAEARIVANEGLFSARKAGDVDLELDLLIVVLHANETLGQYQRARALLDRAEQLEIKLKAPQAELLVIELRMHRLRLCRLDPANCASDISVARQEVYAALDPLFEIAAKQHAIVLLDTVEEIGIEQPEAVARAIAAFRSAFDSEASQRQLARLLREWRDSIGGQRGSSDDALALSVQLLKENQRDQAMQAVGVTQANDWAAYFRRLFDTYKPTQQLISALVGLMRTTLISGQQPATATSALQQQTATALFSAFETRDELLVFLKQEFPDCIARLNHAAIYSDLLGNVVTIFEHDGQTEALVARALAHQPDNTLLLALQQQLVAAVADSSAPRGTLSVEGDKGVGVTLNGNIHDSILSTSGPLQISGNIHDTIFNIFNRSIPREQLDTLPKAMPPFSTTPPPDQLCAAPELVFNWALGMRQAMRAVCLVEGTQAIGTGFLVAPNLLLYALGGSHTMDFSGVRFRFDHHHAPDGALSQPTVYVPAGDPVALHKVFGYSDNIPLGAFLVLLEGMPGTDLVPGENVPRGWLSLSSAPAAAHQSLFLLHHGLGGPQMLEYASARPASDGGIELATLSGKFAGGAGGAPCCNEAWQVVAIRMGTDRKQKTSPPLLVIWAQNLLADDEFAAILKQHLPIAQRDDQDEAATRLKRLLQTLTESFDFEDLQMFATELNIDWGDLPGDTRSTKAQSLLDYANAHGRLDELKRLGMLYRPHAKWE